MVPITARHLLGVRPVAPGYAQVVFDPLPLWPGTYEATIPTPHGPIRVRQERRGAVEYELPRGVEVLRVPSRR